jgi:hypothetical protein
MNMSIIDITALAKILIELEDRILELEKEVVLLKEVTK